MELQPQYAAISHSRHQSDGSSSENDDPEAPQRSPTGSVASQRQRSKDNRATNTANPDGTTATSRRNDTVGWSWEFGAALLSITGLALLIGFLAKVHGTSYGSWQYTTSPNTVVAIITAITKAALLVPILTCLSQLKWNLYKRPAKLSHMQTLDQSSRGPWGSLILLWESISGLWKGYSPLDGALSLWAHF
ncbi:hypothetical protein BJX62DRAFT_241663 [Aspergillus germanicus]